MSEPTDEQLMLRYQGGDEAAFEALYFRHVEALRSYLARGLWVQEDAHDLVQRTFVLVHRARRDYDPGRPFRRWLFRIGLNVKRDYMRRKKPSVALDSDLLDQAAPRGAAEDREHVQVLVSRLPDDLRELVWRHWICGLSYAAIARRTGSTEGAVKVRAHRAIQLLRRLTGARPT